MTNIENASKNDVIDISFETLLTTEGITNFVDLVREPFKIRKKPDPNDEAFQSVCNETHYNGRVVMGVVGEYYVCEPKMGDLVGARKYDRIKACLVQLVDIRQLQLKLLESALGPKKKKGVRKEMRSLIKNFKSDYSLEIATLKAKTMKSVSGRELIELGVELMKHNNWSQSETAKYIVEKYPSDKKYDNIRISIGRYYNKELRTNDKKEQGEQ